MLVFLNVMLKDIDGLDLKDDRKDQPLTLKASILSALTANYRGEESLDGVEKLKRWELALKVKNAPDPTELTVEEIVEIKKLISKLFGTVVVGQTYKLLESGGAKKE